MVNKTKILYCITKGNWGGAQKYVYDLATAVDREQFEVVVLVGQDGLLVSRLKERGIRVEVLGGLSRDFSLWADLISFFKILKIFKREKPDIIHLNSSKMGFLGGLAGRLLLLTYSQQSTKYHLQIIFTGHGWAFNEERSVWQKKVIYWLHKLTVLLSHHTIAVSEQTRQQINPGKFLVKKITVIRNGVGEIDFLEKEIARLKIGEKINQGNTFQNQGISLINRPWVGTISELHKNKGLEYLIEAVHLLRIVTDDEAQIPAVFIIGDGERREKLQTRIDRYGLYNDIFLIGRVNEAEKYLKAFDIFTLTSITEALPYVLLEAGQAGLPVLASGVGGIPEIIEDMQSGIIVRPREPEEIRRALEFLLKNTDKAIAFGQNLRQKIQEHFNKDTMVRKTLEVYRK